MKMVLRPSSISMRNEFQNFINNIIKENNSRLPSISTLESITVIDIETIFEINDLTTSERRIELMRNI